jgi:luciferase family oxidoreductase group 1
MRGAGPAHQMAMPETFGRQTCYGHFMLPLSILDLAPVSENSTPALALQNARDLAQHAEAWGYNRYWVAEHHNMVGIASAATSVVIGFIAAHTKTIRVGAGGIMLPNHSPLVIAEHLARWKSFIPVALI